MTIGDNWIVDRKTTAQDAITYANMIVDGDIVASKYVIKQCQRFLDDLERENDEDFDWYFDFEQAERPLKFIQFLRYTKGSVARQEIKLSLWQAFLIANIYGWRSKSDPDLRKHQKVIALVGRKSAKSTITGALCLWEVVSREFGSEIYCAATDEKQARIVWNNAKTMAELADERLTKNVVLRRDAILNSKKNITFRPLSRDSKNKDGADPSTIIFDEAAAIPSAEFFEVMDSATGAQKNPIQLFITTAQAGFKGYFFETLQYARNVLDGIIEDERIFCLAYELDEDDDWQDLNLVIKAQPNLNISVPIEKYEQWLERAKVIPASAIEYRTKQLNQFIKSTSQFIDIDKWNANGISEKEFEVAVEKLPLHLGMDLGAVSDLTSITQIYGPDTGGNFYARATNFVPQSAYDNVSKYARDAYIDAFERKKLVLVEGDLIDYDVIYDHILELRKKYDLRGVAYDNYNAVMLVSKLEEAGIETTQVAQNARSLSPITKEASILISKGKLIHDGDNFFSWQVSNATVRTDEYDNLKLTKEARENKIDAVIAAMMGLIPAIQLEKPKPKVSWVIV